MLSEDDYVDTKVGLDSISIKLLEILRESVLPLVASGNVRISLKNKQCTTTTSTTSNIPMCIVGSYSCVSIGKERLIPYQGNDSKSFLHRTQPNQATNQR